MNYKLLLSGCLLTSTWCWDQPAKAEPCLTQETLAFVQQRIGGASTDIFLLTTGLGLCQTGSNDDARLSLQRIEELSTEAAMNPEELACPPLSAQTATALQGGRFLVPEASNPVASASTRTCTCARQNEALRLAQEALRRRAQ
jgi:hypothetical protein